MTDDDRKSIAREAAEGFKEGLVEETRTWATCAKWGALVGGGLGAVGGFLVFGGAGVGVGLLIGIPAGAILAWVGYLAINSVL